MYGWETRTEPFQAKLYQCPRCRGTCKSYGWRYVNLNMPTSKWHNLPDCPICDAKGYLTGLIITEQPKKDEV